MKKVTGVALALIALLFNGKVKAQVSYLNESKIDFDKHMQWFREAKYGMFVHFGLYSQLGGDYKGRPVEGYAEWIQAGADIPKEEYAKLIHSWNPSHFDADQVVQLAKDAGMKYLVITTKHHEGFCLWD